MPTYDYLCDECGHKAEIRESMNVERVKSCPNCQKDSFHRGVGGGTALHFKSKGFYATDYNHSFRASGVWNQDIGDVT